MSLAPAGADQSTGRRAGAATPSAGLLADLARQLALEPDRDAVLRRVVDAALGAIDGAEHAGITWVTAGDVTTPVASDDVVCVVDRGQYATGEGPCLDAALEHQHVVRVDDLRTDARWPEFSEAASALGVRSMLSFQLYVGGSRHDAAETTMGALNLYASTAHAFTDDSVRDGTLLAAQAAAAASASERSDHLQRAVQSRDLIGQAKGILMERFRISPDQAFDLLVSASQHTNTKLRLVAEHLTATGELLTS